MGGEQPRDWCDFFPGMAALKLRRRRCLPLSERPGQRRAVPTVMEEQALVEEFVFINGGQRGLQVRLDPKVALEVLGGKATALVA